MIQPSVLNVLIIGLSMVIFTFLWRMAAAKFAESDSLNSVGEAMAVTL
jgi:hypothetical protein